MFGISGGSFGGSGVKKYAVVADLPLTNVKPGTLAHVELNLQGESALYLWSGTQISGGWYKVATVNLAPSLTQGPEAAYALPTDGSPITLSLIAEDPEGLPISWSYQLSGGTIDGVADVLHDNGTFTISADPAAIANSTPGAFSLTFVASDGVSLSAATSAFKLSFAIGLTDPVNATLSAEIPSPNQSVSVSRGGIVGPDLYLLLSGEAGPVGALYEVSDPSAPAFIANLPTDPVFTGSPMAHVRGNGAGKFFVGDGTTDNVLLFDASNPSAPFVVENTFSIYRGDPVGSNKTHAVFAGEGRVSVMSFETGLETGFINYGYPDTPTLVRTVSYPAEYDGDVFVTGIRNAASGDYRLAAFRVESNGSLTELSLYVGDTNVYFSGFDGRFAVARRIDTGAFQVWDYVDPTAPVKVFEESASQTGVGNAMIWAAMQDGFFYAASSFGATIYVYSVSSVGHLTLLGNIEGAGPVGSALTAASFANGALFFPSRDAENRPAAKVFMN